MKLGIISDIHANVPGLQRALEIFEEERCDEILCAGDSFYQFRFSNEVIETLKERKIRLVLGNHEDTLLSRDGERARNAPWVRQDLVEWISEQPYRLETKLDGKLLLVTHGSPWDPWKEYLYPTDPKLQRVKDLEQDVIILGHTHYQMALRFGNKLVINPGSAGEPRDHRIDFQLSVATYDTETEEVKFHNFPDPTRNIAKGF